MSEHQALYRKWRPQQFSQVVGQTYTLRTLVNALAHKEIAHAYLFAGPRGTGKTTVARLFARAVNCLQRQQGEPCNRCDACERISRGASLDVVEIDGASNRGIDQIRKLREEVSFVPADVKYKVYIIDEVHMLTNEAFNALLKTLEEPPKRVVFIFATTEPHKLPATVTSRCQAFEFTHIPLELIVNHLTHICQAENIQADERALHAIASRCGGALRDALVTLEQLASYAQGEPISGETLETVLGLPSETLLQDFLQRMLSGQVAGVVDIIHDLVRRGQDLELFLEELIRLGRDWLVQAAMKKPLPVSVEPRHLAELIYHLLQLKRDMGRAWDKQIWLEVGVLRWPQAAAPKATASNPTPTPPQTPTPNPTTATPAAGDKPALPSPVRPPAQPEATESPPAAAKPSSAQSNLWQSLLNAIRKERVAVYAYLVEGHPELQGRVLHIRYHRPRHNFHKESAEKPEIKAYLMEKAKAAYGADIALRIEFFAESAAEGGQPQLPPTSALEEKVTMIKRVLGEDEPQA
ncbi:MAG TPA: DNA polymerase III subunit gamma/tau [Candidatus Bipolaricaulota bacterium]